MGNMPMGEDKPSAGPQCQKQASQRENHMTGRNELTHESANVASRNPLSADQAKTIWSYGSRPRQ